MPDQVGLVIGPTGATGRPIAAALARRSGWRVYGMSRTAPLGEVPFTHLVADLTDPASCRRALATIEPVTHAFFAARAPFREGGVEDVEGNLAMLATTLDAVETPSLEHVHLLEGIKWYGMHLGPYPTPSREAVTAGAGGQAQELNKGIERAAFPPTAEMMGKAVNALQSGDPREKLRSMEVLGMLGLVLRSQKDQPPEVRAKGDSLIDAVKKARFDSDPNVRSSPQ